MRRVPERIEDRSEIVGDIVGDLERIECRNHQILGKCALAIHADADGVATQMTTTRAAVAAVTAGDMAFSGNAVADLEPAHLLPHLDDLADVFVADMHRHRYR